MILLLSGTNRFDSNTKLVSDTIYRFLSEEGGEEVKMLSLETLPLDTMGDFMFGKVSPALAAIQDELIIPSDKWIIIAPEYNGSFPGILKLFIDAISVRKYNQSFAGKYVALLGVATGRGGNLRGLEHLTGIFQYLKMHVYHHKLPISRIEELKDDLGNLNMSTCEEICKVISSFLDFTRQNQNYFFQ